MKRKAKVAETYGVKPLFDNRKRRRLFRNEKHPLSLVKRVGNDVRYGLGFAGSGWPVQNEGGTASRRL